MKNMPYVVLTRWENVYSKNIYILYVLFSDRTWESYDIDFKYQSKLYDYNNTHHKEYTIKKIFKSEIMTLKHLNKQEVVKYINDKKKFIEDL